MQSRYREVCGQLKSPHLFTGHTPDSMRTFSMLEWNWSELNPSLWQQERRGMCMNCQKVWSAEPGAINSPQLKHDGSPLPLPYRTVLKPRTKWKGVDFLFLGPNQRAVTTIGYNSKEPISDYQLQPAGQLYTPYRSSSRRWVRKGSECTANKWGSHRNVSPWWSFKSGDVKAQRRLECVAWLRETEDPMNVFPNDGGKRVHTAHTPLYVN